MRRGRRAGRTWGACRAAPYRQRARFREPTGAGPAQARGVAKDFSSAARSDVTSSAPCAAAADPAPASVRGGDGPPMSRLGHNMEVALALHTGRRGLQVTSDFPAPPPHATPPRGPQRTGARALAPVTGRSEWLGSPAIPRACFVLEAAGGLGETAWGPPGDGMGSPGLPSTGAAPCRPRGRSSAGSRSPRERRSTAGGGFG